MKKHNNLENFEFLSPKPEILGNPSAHKQKEELNNFKNFWILPMVPSIRHWILLSICVQPI